MTLFTVCVVAAILGAMGLFVRVRVHANLVDEIDRQLRNDVGTVKTGSSMFDAHVKVRPLGKGDAGTTIRRSEEAQADIGHQNRVMQVLRSQKGDVRLEATWNAPRLIPAIGAFSEIALHAEDPAAIKLAAEGAIFHEFVQAGQPMRSLTTPVRQGGQVVAYVQAIRPLGPVERQMSDLDRALETSIPVAILLAALGGGLLVRNAMRPLRRMNDAARRLDRDLSSARLPVEGTDEFAELARGINAAFDRTAATFAEQQRALVQLERFTGDAGHELRTPLASIKTNASYLLHLAEVPADTLPAIRSIDTSADRMTKLIGDLLLLARQDGGRGTLKPAEVDLRIMVEEVLQNLTNLDGPEVKNRIDPGLTAFVDRDVAERVLLNLISNALRYARTEVVIAAELSPTELQIEVRDDGEGIAPEDLARLGERFFRPDEARSRQQGGVGLGLAIVKSLAEAHGGTLVIESEVGTGTVATVRLRTVGEAL